jgi:hypothetical protein
VRRSIAAIMALLALAGCDSKPDGAPFAIDNVVKNVSFFGAHQEEHCSKGCYSVDVPDKWFFQFCSIKDPADCFTKSITHAPWKWEREGAHVTVTWQRWTSGNQYVVKWVLTDTGEVVDF